MDVQKNPVILLSCSNLDKGLGCTWFRGKAALAAGGHFHAYLPGPSAAEREAPLSPFSQPFVFTTCRALCPFSCAPQFPRGALCARLRANICTQKIQLVVSAINAFKKYLEKKMSFANYFYRYTCDLFQF